MLSADPGSEERAWRTVLGRRLASLIAGLSIVAMVTLAADLGASPSDGWWVLGFGGLAALLALTARRSTSPTRRAITVVAVTLLSATLGYARFGVTPGPALALALAVTIAGLLLGRRAMVATLALGAVAITVVGELMVHGAIATPTVHDISPEEGTVWIRTSVFTVLAVFVLAALVTWVVERVEVAAARAEREIERRHDAERKALAAQQAELIGQVAAGLAHDVNNHLAVISMWSTVLLSSRTDEDVEEATDEIGEAIRQATALTRRVLVLGRRGIQNPRPLSLRALVTEQTTTLQRVLKPNIVLQLPAPAEEAWALVDEGQLHQVLLNLAMNARDALPDGGTVIVRTGACDRRGAATAFLSIEDDGVGMSDEVLRRATEPFFTTRPPGKGQGLGLAAVAAIARQSDGELVLESTPGVGTKATFYLPAIDAPADGPVAEAAPRPTLQARVLLAEDSPALAQIVRRTLQEAGCSVVVAVDGDEAVRRMAEGRFDLLCSDVVMPGRPTREVIAAFEAQNPGAPVLLCSGYVGEELVRRGIEAGRYRFLAKPYSPDQLLAAIATLVTSDAAAARSKVG